VNLDPRLLRYVLRNLLSNAAKYSPPGSRIDLHVMCLDEGHVRLRVSDQGRGIPPDDLPHLFEPFQRASNVEGTQGIGLGLAIVKQSVTLLGGTISVESVEGQGTTFTVILPIQSQPESNDKPLSVA
jgi:signal transduction histidine kinase